MNRFVQHLVLVLVGASVAVMLVKGTYLNYVKPALLPWLAIAAAVLIVLGAAALYRDVHGTTHVDDGHGHGQRGRLVWLLLLPIALIAFVVPPPLDARGATAAAPSATAPSPRAFPPLPPGPAPTVPVPEVVMRAAADPAKSLDGRTITMSGFTLHYPDGVYLARVVIVCCAADAQLARVRLAGPAAGTAAAFGEQTWVEVRGRVEPGSARAENDFIPTVSADAVTHIDEPKNTYAY